MCKIWRRNRNIEQTYAYIVHHQQLTRTHQKMTYRTWTFTQCARKPPEFAEITPLCRLRLFKVTDFGTNRKLIYDFLLVIITNLPPILYRFRDIAIERSEIAIPLLCLTPPAEGFPWDDLREIFNGCQSMAKVPNAVEILPKIWTAWVGRTNVTDDRRQTDGRAIAYSERER